MACCIQASLANKAQNIKSHKTGVLMTEKCHTQCDLTQTLQGM